MDEGQSRTFKAKFEGEGGDDYGGLYRETFTFWSSELTATTMSPDGAAEEGSTTNSDETEGGEHKDEEQAGDSGHLQCVLPLLHPCPNRLHGVGSNREKFILRPSSSVPSGSGAHLLLETYSFLGQLMGIALRTKVNLNVDLASIVWKVLTGEHVGLEDLRDIDHSAVALVDTFMAAQRGADAPNGTEMLEAMCEELRWSASMSDGTEVEFFPGGKTKKVDVRNCSLYANVLVESRLRESENAVAAVRDGLTSIIPAPVLPLLTGEELERLVCGSPELDVELLKQCTEYDDDLRESDAHIQSFWRVLGSFSNANRQRFLRFVWARSRLPGTKAEFSQRFKIQAPVGEGPRESPDEYLPKAATCFFALSLPRYSSDEVMREKLLYACTECLAMDGDFRLTDSEHTGWDNLPGVTQHGHTGAAAMLSARAGGLSIQTT